MKYKHNCVLSTETDTFTEFLMINVTERFS